WVRELGATDAFIGWRTTLASLALTAGYFGWGRFAGRKGHLRVLLLCALGMSFYPLLTAFTSPRALWLLVVAGVVWGAFNAGVELGLFEWVIEAAQGERRLAVFALNMAHTNLAMFLS